MELTSKTVFIISILLSFLLVSSAQSHKNYPFASKQGFSSCSELPVLQANLHWNYIPETKSVHIAYRANQAPTGWVAWAINPTGTGMVGSQAIVAFRHSNGTMAVYTTAIDGYNPLMQPGNLSFPVSNVSATYANSEMTIFAVVGPLPNGTTFNHAWQAGPVSKENPQIHSTSGPNVESMGTLDLLSSEQTCEKNV